MKSTKNKSGANYVDREKFPYSVLIKFYTESRMKEKIATFVFKRLHDAGGFIADCEGHEEVLGICVKVKGVDVYWRMDDGQLSLGRPIVAGDEDLCHGCGAPMSAHNQTN